MDVDINGTRRSVSLRRDGHAWTARVNGRDVVLDVVRAGGTWSMLVRAPGDAAAPVSAWRSHEIAFEGRGGDLTVYLDGHAFAGAVPQLRRYAAREAGASAGLAAGARQLLAPMPGRVVKVLVTSGEHVQARQPLVVVEAMKMENELRAPRAGTVTAIAVEAGSPVEAGQVLLILT